MGATRVAFHEYPLLPPRLLGDRQRRPLSPTSRPAPACVGRAWRAAAPLAPLASALVFSRRLLVRPCRLFVSTGFCAFQNQCHCGGPERAFSSGCSASCTLNMIILLRHARNIASKYIADPTRGHPKSCKIALIRTNFADAHRERPQKRLVMNPIGGSTSGTYSFHLLSQIMHEAEVAHLPKSRKICMQPRSSPRSLRDRRS